MRRTIVLGGRGAIIETFPPKQQVTGTSALTDFRNERTVRRLTPIVAVRLQIIRRVEILPPRIFSECLGTCVLLRVSVKSRDATTRGDPR